METRPTDLVPLAEELGRCLNLSRPFQPGDLSEVLRQELVLKPLKSARRWDQARVLAYLAMLPFLALVGLILTAAPAIADLVTVCMVAIMVAPYAILRQRFTEPTLNRLLPSLSDDDQIVAVKLFAARAALMLKKITAYRRPAESSETGAWEITPIPPGLFGADNGMLALIGDPSQRWAIKFHAMKFAGQFEILIARHAMGGPVSPIPLQPEQGDEPGQVTQAVGNTARSRTSKDLIGLSDDKYQAIRNRSIAAAPNFQDHFAVIDAMRKKEFEELVSGKISEDTIQKIIAESEFYRTGDTVGRLIRGSYDAFNDKIVWNAPAAG
jgi:hypothetical protein